MGLSKSVYGYYCIHNICKYQGHMDVRLIVSGIGFGRVEGAELIKMDPFYVPNVWGLLKNVWGLFKNIWGLLKNVWGFPNIFCFWLERPNVKTIWMISVMVGVPVLDHL